MNDIFDSKCIPEKCSETKSDIQKLAEIFISNPSDSNFSKLVNRMKWGIRGYIFNVVKNDYDTNVIYNMILERIYFKRHLYDSTKSTFSTWVYKMTHNVVLNYIRDENKKKITCISQDFEDIYDSYLNSDYQKNSIAISYIPLIDIINVNGKLISLGKEEVLSEIMDASIDCISYLPNNLKTVMYERIVNNKTISEIAEENDIPVSSVKNWMRKGKTELKNELKNKYGYLYDLLFESAQKAV